MPLQTPSAHADAGAAPSEASGRPLPWGEVLRGLGVAFLVIASLCVIVGFLALPVAPLP